MSQPLISIILKGLELGGAERVLVTLAGEFCRLGMRVDLAVLKRDGPLLPEVSPEVRFVELGKASRIAALTPALHRSSRIPLVRLIPMMIEGLPSITKRLPKIAAYYDRERPDAVLASLPQTILAALWAKEVSNHKPRLVIREANTFSLDSGAGARLFDRALPAIAKEWYPRGDKIVAVSEGAARDLENVLGLEAEQVSTINNPVDVERCTSLSAEAVGPADQAWLQRNKLPILVNVGRLQPQKDQATLIRAFAKVRAALPCRLLVLGEGPLRTDLEALAASLGLGEDIYLPGARPNPFPYLARANLFVLSSAWEGFPNVVLEALAFGCPVVSTDCPSGPADLLAGGKLGHLAKVGDADELAKAILETLAAPPATQEALLARAGDFAPRRIAKCYLDALLDREGT